MNQCSEFADLLLPDLVVHAGAHIGGIVDFINAVDAQGKLDSKHLRGTHELVEQEAATALEIIKKLQQPSGSRWHAGVSGPYELDPSLDTLTAGGDTFSSFTPWEEVTPEQHLASILETLRDWRISIGGVASAITR